jgi:Domain of unknown function (DUF6265)
LSREAAGCTGPSSVTVRVRKALPARAPSVLTYDALYSSAMLMPLPSCELIQRRLGALAILPLCLALGSRPTRSAQVEGGNSAQHPAPVVNGPLVQDLAFISGHWQGGVTGGIFDEEWSPPSADSMMGMFRYMEGGAVKFYEFMVIEATATGPVLRLRHFDPGLVGWEDKNAALSLPVSSFTEKQVVFSNVDNSIRLTYRRSSPDALTVILEHNAGGHKGRQEFDYSLVK